jgi:hypothetical protein
MCYIVKMELTKMKEFFEVLETLAKICMEAQDIPDGIYHYEVKVKLENGKVVELLNQVIESIKKHENIERIIW